MNDIQIDIDQIKLEISNSASSRRQFYKEINSDYIVHDIYKGISRVNEIERISWTRMRLSAHSLAIESGRWNRRGRGRLPVEERLCTCGQIQSEKHVIEDCPRTAGLRNQFAFENTRNLFKEMSDYHTMCKITHMLLQEYQ